MEVQKMMVVARLICMTLRRKCNRHLCNPSAATTRYSSDVTWCRFNRVLIDVKSKQMATLETSHYRHFTNSRIMDQHVSRNPLNPLSTGELIENRPFIKFGSKTITNFKDKLATKNDVVMTESDWDNLRKTCLEENAALSKSFDMIIVQLLYGSRQLSLAIDFMKWAENQRKLHFSVQAVFLAICGVCGGKEHQHRIFQAYSKIEEQTKLFDAITCKYLIKGFCYSDQWKKSLEFLEMSRITQSPSESYYNPICHAALKEGDAELANKLLVEMGEYYLVPSEEVFLEYVLQCRHNLNGISISMFLHYLRNYFWFPSKLVAEAIEEYFLM